MNLSRIAKFPRRTYLDLDFARHMPKEYVERVKRTVPKKVYSGRFGAPDITRWALHPEDYVSKNERPWENNIYQENLDRSNKYQASKINNKFFELRRPKSNIIPAEEWIFYPGDQVQVMVGKDKGRQGTVLRISKETNEIFVDGLHTKLEEEQKGSEKMGLDRTLRWKEQPLRVDKQQVMLVDPNDSNPCTAEWILNTAGTEYIRISKTSGYEIPLPSQAKVTYDYLAPEKYIEVEAKDTPTKLVLERTYVPKLCSFEEEIMESMGIVEERVTKPTYWY